MEFISRHRLGLFVWITIGVIALVLWEARGALPVFGIAIALAFLLDPPVTALNRRFGVPRLAGILLVYVVVVVAVVGLGYLLIPPLFDQVKRFLEELPPREVARRMGVKVETVRTRTKRALARLREGLDGEYGERKPWSLALSPLALPRRAAGPLLGALVVDTKVKLLAAAALCALVAVTWSWRSSSRSGAGAARAPGRTGSSVAEEDAKDDEGWKFTDTFGRDDLLLVAKVADLAHSWIFAQTQSQDDEKTTRNRR